MSKAFIFPGQGSQVPGMGKSLAENFGAAKGVFSEVDDCLGQKLSHIIFEGPEADLTLTRNAQPALMAVSLAVVRVLQAEAGLNLATHAAFVAGHSLGEYSALAAAGALTIGDTARLLRLRGEAMQRAVPVGAGAMAALLGIEADVAKNVAAQAMRETGEICEVANDNGGGQIVISGSKAAVALAMELAKAQGVRRALPLPVSAPFHCSMMHPAAMEMQMALASVALGAPCVPLVSNVLAQAVTDPADIRALLVQQVTGTVRWRESVSFMAGQGAAQFYELGAGKVLSGLVKRICDGATGMSIGSPIDIEAYKAQA